MKKIFFIFVFFFVFLSIAFAQEKNSPQEESHSLENTPLIIEAIEVRGNKSVSTNTILSKIKSQIGSHYQDNIVSDDIKRLNLLGFFSDISIETQPFKDGLKLIINVTENPIIEKIYFIGMRRVYIKEEKLKEMLKSKEKEYLNNTKIKEDIEILRDLYVKKGFSDTEISYEVSLNKEKNSAQVKFIVKEAMRLKIKDIRIKGNKAYPAKRILKLIKTRRAWLFNAGILKEETLKDDIKKIIAFYKHNGYADAQVNYTVSRHPRKPFLYIDIQIEEGKKYLTGKVAITGNSVFSEAEIRKVLKNCLENKVFSEEGIKEDVANIQGLYFDKGYIFAQVKESFSLNPQTGQVDISYNIVENEVGYVNRIKIRGNIKTKDVVIRRELRLYPGERFDGEKLKRSKERLQNLGFFEEVSFDTEDTDIPNRKDLVVDVKEAKTGTFSFGGGYSTIDEFVGFVEIEQRNFDWKNFPYFTGDGQDLKLRASFGTLSDSYILSFTEPWLFDYPLSFGFDLYRQSHEREADVGYGYDQKRTGGDLRLGKELTEYLRADLEYRYDTIEISDVSEEATQELKKELGKNAISSIELSLTQDKRDNRFLPTQGYLLTGSWQIAGGIFGGDKDFFKFLGRASKYLPLWQNSVLELRMRVGLADAYGDSNEIPIYERFFAGGSSTVRGYEERKLGPYDAVTKDPLGGDSLLVTNIEYTYPIFDFLRAAAFLDSGNVWEKTSDIGSGGFKSSWGLGLRLKTPLGPINLDYGIPFNKDPGKDKKSNGRFHFNVGYGF